MFNELSRCNRDGRNNGCCGLGGQGILSDFRVEPPGRETDHICSLMLHYQHLGQLNELVNNGYRNSKRSIRDKSIMVLQ